MRLIALAALLLPLVALACAQGGPRAFDGKAERGTTQILAITTANETFKTTPGADGSFTIQVPSVNPVRIFALHDGIMQTMKFAAKIGGPRLATKIPDSEGTIHLGALSSMDCNGDGNATDETTPENDPADQVDSDNDGTPDAEDADTPDDAGTDPANGAGDPGANGGNDSTGDVNGGTGDDGQAGGDTGGDSGGNDGTGDDGGTAGGDTGGDDGDAGGDTGGDNGGGGDCGHGGDTGGDNGGDTGAGGDTGNNGGDGTAGEGEGEGEGEGDAVNPQG